MCEIARMAIFQAFACRGIKNKNLKTLISMNNFFSMRFVAAVRQQRPSAFINAHGIEDLSAKIMEEWQQKIADKSFTPDQFNAELARRIVADSTLIDIGAERPTTQEIEGFIRAAAFEGGVTIGTFLKAWADQQQFSAPKPASLGKDAVTLSDKARGELDKTMAVNQARTGSNDPDLCG